MAILPDINRKQLALYWTMIFTSLLASIALVQSEELNSHITDGFVSLAELDPSIIQEMRYAGDHNFVGRPIPGYSAEKCYLTKEAATSLQNIQTELKAFSLSLKVYECYRPQKAVDSFILWAKDLNDVKMRAEFYPKVEKTNLFKDGYIAEKSGHSRGSTVDLTLTTLPVVPQKPFKKTDKLVSCTSSHQKRFPDNTLDMGTGYDCFDPLSHTLNPAIGQKQKQNRLLLKTMMEKHGFKNLAEEWWHFTLIAERFPVTYFNFEVK